MNKSQPNPEKERERERERGEEKREIYIHMEKRERESGEQNKQRVDSPASHVDAVEPHMSMEVRGSANVAR